MKVLTKELSELYGILIGDGCLSEFKNEGRLRRIIRIDGHGTDDLEYYEKHVIPLIKKITKKEVKLR